MRAVVLAGKDRVEVAEVPPPRVLEPDDAVVRVTCASICGSDLHLLSGKTPGMEPGKIIGHEFVGVIEEVGPGAGGLVAGTRVVGSFLIACGACDRCLRGRFNLCRSARALGLGSLTGDLEGAQAELVRVPHARVNLHEIGDGLDDEHALFGGDILATAFYAAARADIDADDTVAVVGGGPVGLLCAVAAARARPRRIFLLESDPARASFARATFGIEVVEVPDGDARAALAAATEGEMADAVFEAVGSVPALRSALGCVRAGGRLVVVGVYGKERYELSLGRAWASAIDIRFCGLSNVHAHWDDALEAVRSQEIDPTALITHDLPLERAEEAYELFAAREAIKVALRPPGGV